MEKSFENDFPLELIVVAFIVLALAASFLQRTLKNRARILDGQLPADGSRMPSIEERVAGNREWAGGKIRAKGLGFVIIMWLVALVWQLTFGVSFIKSLSNPEMKTGGQVVLGVFSVIGLVAVAYAIYLTIRRLRYGDSWCFIKGKAGVLGKELSGTIRTSTEVRANGNFTISLQCIDFYSTGSGKNRRTESTIHWQGKQTVPYSGQSSQAGIPFSIPLPANAPETGCRLARGWVSWQLEISAPTDGVDYSALFVVPVFKM